MGRYDSIITGGKKYAMNRKKMTNCHCDPERSEGEAISANVGTDLQVCPLLADRFKNLSLHVIFQSNLGGVTKTS